jgi:hypothetical protein
MIHQFQTQRLPTRSAVGRRGRTNTAAFVTSVALMAHLLSACSIPLQSVSQTSTAVQYPDLNDPPSMAEVRADQVAQIKAEMIQVRDDQERAAVRQQTPHTSGALVSVVLQ